MMNLNSPKGNKVLDAWDEMIAEITVDAYGDDEQLWAFRQAFEDDVRKRQHKATADDLDLSKPVELVALSVKGQTVRCRLLMALCEADLRCLDAHTHLGNLRFDHWPQDAIRYYEVGLRIGELSLGDGFAGVLPWGLIDNRPFLRCMHVSGVSIALTRPSAFLIGCSG